MGCSKGLTGWVKFQFLVAVVFLVLLFTLVPTLVAHVNADLDAFENGEYDNWKKQQYDLLVRNSNDAGGFSNPILFKVNSIITVDETGVPISEHEIRYGREETERMEQLLGVDFTDPNSYNQIAVSQRIEDLQAAVDNFKVEYDYDPNAPSEPAPKRSLRGGWVDANGNKVEAPKIKPPTNSARIAAATLMGATIIPAAGIWGGTWYQRRSEEEHSGMSALQLCMLCIIVAALAFGIHGLSGDFVARNKVFLNVTTYAMYIIFGAMCLTCIAPAISVGYDSYVEARAARRAIKEDKQDSKESSLYSYPSSTDEETDEETHEEYPCCGRSALASGRARLRRLLDTTRA